VFKIADQLTFAWTAAFEGGARRSRYLRSVMPARAILISSAI
jgi:hypothetical protein